MRVHARVRVCGGVGGGCKVSSMQNRLSFAIFRLFKALLGKS